VRGKYSLDTPLHHDPHSYTENAIRKRPKTAGSSGCLKRGTSIALSLPSYDNSNLFSRWVVSNKFWTSSGVTAGIDMTSAFLRHLLSKYIPQEEVQRSLDVVLGVLEIT
jgi:hypothetical protein